MNNIKKDFIDEDGNSKTVIASSDDEYNLDLDRDFVLANRNKKKENKLVQKFKSSFLGSDIGIKSSGFTSVTILAVVIAIAVLAVIYFMWHF